MLFLSYSIMLLQTDLTNSNIKTKITKDTYVKMTKNVLPMIKDCEYEEIYERVKKYGIEARTIEEK